MVVMCYFKKHMPCDLACIWCILVSYTYKGIFTQCIVRG